MPSSLVRRTACVLLLLSAACASGGASGPHATPPRMQNADYPDLSSIGPQGNTRTDVSVMVDPDGTPDMSTLKISGNGAPAMRQLLTDWISHSTFIPGSTGGLPVRAEFKMKLESKTTTVRRAR